MILKRGTLASFLMAFLLAASVQAQDLPEGAGKDLVTKVCTVCHDVTRITSKKRTKEEWSDTVDKMAARGAMATDEEFETIVTYLARNFARDQAPGNSIAAYLAFSHTGVGWRTRPMSRAPVRFYVRPFSGAGWTMADFDDRRHSRVVARRPG